MQYDNEKFDLLVRSMMQDAEEPVSPRVWEGVSAGLAARKRRPVFLWFAAGIAAAAAVVLGVVLPGLHDDNSNLPIINNNIVSLETSGPDDPTPDGDGKAGLADVKVLIADNAVSPVRKKDIGLSRTTVRETGVAETADSGSLQVSGPEITAEEDRESFVSEAGRQPVRTAGTLSETEEDFADPFAQMEWEDARREQDIHVSVAFGGSMESNGNPASPGIQVMRAPANQQLTHTVIQQTGATSSYAIPVSAGLNIRVATGGRWSVGTGLNWTMLQRSFNGTFRENGEDPVYSEINNTLHYIGIPLNAYYTLLQSNRIGLYAFAGGSVEKAVSNQFRATAAPGLFHKESVKGVQFSAAAGFGVQFQLVPHVGLYVDPSLRWYIPGNQPRSIRTQQPLMMDFEVGLRFDI